MSASDFKVSKLEVVFGAKEMPVTSSKRVEPEIGKPRLSINPIRLVRTLTAWVFKTGRPVCSRPQFKIAQRIRALSITVSSPTFQRPNFTAKRKISWWDWWV